MTHVMTTSGQKIGSIALVVWELRPIEVGKKVIFWFFFYFVNDQSILWDILTLKRWPAPRQMLGLPLGKKMGFVALVVWELWPVKIEKRVIFFFMFCIRFSKLMGYFCFFGGDQSHDKCQGYLWAKDGLCSFSNLGATACRS